MLATIRASWAVLIILGLGMVSACKMNATTTESRTLESGGSYSAGGGGGGTSASVTWYTIGDMPVECPAPQGVDKYMGIAITEGNALIDGVGCGYGGGIAPFDGSLPKCSDILRKLCGRTYTVSYNGISKVGYLSGICPINHPNNTPKGQWNPCGAGRTHLDLMEPMYVALGLDKMKHSWGENGNTGTVNPSAASVQVQIKDRGGHLTPCTFAPHGCSKDLFPH